MVQHMSIVTMKLSTKIQCYQNQRLKRHHLIAYHRCRQAVACGVMRVAKQGTDKNLADLFTKVLSSARRAFLLERFTY